MNMVRRFDSSAVQGEGSWVEVRNIPLREFKEIWNRVWVDVVTNVIKEYVVDWNWVGDDGKRLPTPRARPSLIEELTIDEAKFLCGILVSWTMEVLLKES